MKKKTIRVEFNPDDFGCLGLLLEKEIGVVRRTYIRSPMSGERKRGH
ncbi:MAG: hypothetical protein WDN08_05440 [Rhizomicrobium sp.]